MIAEENSIDYLSKLPNEIWFEILSLALLLLPPGLLFELDPFGFDTLPSQKILHSHQYIRFNTLALCKTLLPLLEQLLFTDVILGTQNQYDLFLSQAMANSGGRRYRGEWTKRIHISPPYSQDVFVDFDSIFTSCPNLISLDLGYHVIVESYYAYLQQYMTRSLKHLLWMYIYFDWKTLQLLSIHFPNLTQLGVQDFRYADDVEDRGAIFKSLKHFIASYDVVADSSSSKLIMPSLRTVTIIASSGFNRPMGNFFIHNGRNLRSLRLTEEFTHRTKSFPTGSQLFDSFCPSLKSLELNTTAFNPIPVSDATTVIPHQELTHLKLMFHWTSKDVRRDIQLHALYFSPQRFPNLQFVTGVPYDMDNQSDVKEFLEGLFPNATVDIDLTRNEPVPYKREGSS